jgi:hypothetical protein
MKASAKMKRSIAKLIKKYGELEVSYGVESVESVESVRVGRGFWDYAELHCPILHKDWTVNHTGEIY